MGVGRVERIRIAHVDLGLADVGLALGVLDHDPRAIEAVAQRAHDRLLAGREEDVVILVVADHRHELAIALVAQVFVAVLEDEEFELARHHRRKAHRLGARDLALEDGARGMGDLGVGVMVDQVREHERGRRLPGGAAQRLHVGLHDVVAIARRPACRGIALHRVHLDVGREQVVAAMRLFPAALDEETGVKALAHQAALHVDGGDDDGVDLARIDEGGEGFEGQVAGHGSSSDGWRLVGTMPIRRRQGKGAGLGGRACGSGGAALGRAHTSKPRGCPPR